MMIRRIVRLRFRKNKAREFLIIFRENCQAIRNFEGCMSLELLQDTDDPNTYFTLSDWKSEAALQKYRRSALFRSTWKKMKPLFRAKAQAWTVTRYISL
jgi:quinol monooxygenase YgiN